MIIHGLPEEAGDIQKWLAKLDVGIDYRGEGLPAIAVELLLHLIRHGRERVYLIDEEAEELLEQYRSRL